MLARHAESLFWAGRYLERAEDTARMLDVTYHGLLESPSELGGEAWRDLLGVLNLSAHFAVNGGTFDAASVSEFLVLDETNDGSIVTTLERARENIRSVRELVSTELWEAINVFYLELQERNLERDLNEQPYELYRLVRRRCQTVSGVASETMPRDDGWRFLMLGWMLERAEMTCRLLSVRYDELRAVQHDGGFHAMVGVLKSASASEAYRKVYGASMRPAGVVEFLLLNRSFPRSLLYCLRQAEKDLTRLGSPDELTRPQRLLGRLRAELEFRDVGELLTDDLDDFLDQVQRGVRNVADAIGDAFFRNAEDLDLHPLDFHPPGAGPRPRTAPLPRARPVAAWAAASRRPRSRYRPDAGATP